MKIAIDYDDTYTLDPPMWDNIIHMLVFGGHDVRIVTARHYNLDQISYHFSIPVIYCNGVAKGWWCHHYADFEPDVWIDDKPKGILENSTATKEWLAEWRATRK